VVDGQNALAMIFFGDSGFDVVTIATTSPLSNQTSLLMEDIFRLKNQSVGGSAMEFPVSVHQQLRFQKDEIDKMNT
jgi:hypothetical protein